MKLSRSLTAFAAALFLAGAAFAGNASEGKLRLYESVSVQGKQLTPGTYKVEWTGKGSDVQVTILNGKGTIATLPAKVVATNTKNSNDGYSAAKQPDGSNDLRTIFFHGQAFELQVGQEAVNGAPQSGAAGSN
jgi:hypothetical protein